MKKLLLGPATALALLAFPVTANPIIKVNSSEHSSFHPAKMHLGLPGMRHGFEKGKHKVNFGYCGLTHETGSATEDFTAPSPSDYQLTADLRVPEDAITPGNPGNGPVSDVPAIPEPSTLALFGLFAMVLALRGHWASWHR